MKKKRPGKGKKKTAGRRAPKKKTSRKKSAKRRALRLALRTGLAAAALNEVAEAPAEPIGACYWVDASGQNRCKVTTQSECEGISGSTFRPNKRCAGGIG
jgi:uncharacterized membrane protein